MTTQKADFGNRSCSPCSEDIRVLTPTSFVFTSTKIGSFHRNIFNESVLTSVLALRSNSTPPTPTGTHGPILTAGQVATHAFGATNALPVHSTFRREGKDLRPSPIRAIATLPTPSTPQGLHNTTLNSFQSQSKSQASKDFYIQLIGRVPPPNDSYDYSPSRTPNGEPAPKNDGILPNGPPVAPQSSSSSTTPRNDEEDGKHEPSYFDLKPRQPSTSHQ